MKNKQFQDSIAQVIKHFDGWECCIEVACHENVKFRSLCEDYAVCASSLENWLDQRYVHDQSDKITGPRDPHTP